MSKPVILYDTLFICDRIYFQRNGLPDLAMVARTVSSYTTSCSFFAHSHGSREQSLCIPFRLANTASCWSWDPFFNTSFVHLVRSAIGNKYRLQSL